jgi:hypothetical protein
LGVKVKLDKTVEANPILVMEKGTISAKLSLSKDIMIVDHKSAHPGTVQTEYEWEGLTLIAFKTGKVYVPHHAVLLLNHLSPIDLPLSSFPCLVGKEKEYANLLDQNIIIC